MYFVGKHRLGGAIEGSLMVRNDTVRERLDQLIRENGSDYAALSRLLGRNPSYVQQFVKYGVPKKLDEEDRRLLAEHFNVSEVELGARPAGKSERLSARLVPNNDSREIHIPYFNIGASAGAGSVLEEEQPDHSLVFDSSWARSLASSSVSALSVLRVKGDSMMPTLNDGEHIVIDTADRERPREGIYVLRIDDALYVKRVTVNPVSKRLSINSDNPLHSQWPDCDPSHINLIGRVVWVGRKL
jgi:phage repressor protein C with HTH and peptisase S24 domain